MNDDWRLTNQENYLRGAEFRKSRYVAPRAEWDHDHCEFCWTKLVENAQGHDDILDEGYCTLDGYRWVCPICFEDFRQQFGWTVAE